MMLSKIPFTLALWLGLVLVLVACSPNVTDTDTPVVSLAAATNTPLPTTTIPTEATITTSATISTPPELTTTQPATVAADEPGELPISETLVLNQISQFGGTPNALKVVGTTVYAGFGPRLMVLDASNAAAPQLLGQSDPLPDLVQGVEVVNGLAYVAAGRAGILVLNVQDPAHMQPIGTGFQDAAADSFLPEAITIRQNIAYVVHFDRANGVKTLYLFDVSNPAQINLISQHHLDVNDELAFGEGVLYVLGINRLQIREAANPDNILNQTTLVNADYAVNAAASGNTLFVVEAGEANGVELFNVSDPTAPVATGELVEMEFIFINQVLTNGEVLVIGGTFGEFGYCSSTIQVIGVGTGQPELQNSFDPANCLTEMALEGNILYVAGWSGLQLYDLSNPAQPALLSQFTHPDGFQDAQGVAQADGVTYILTGEGQGYDLLTFDLAQNPPQPLSDKMSVGTTALLDLYITGQSLLIPQWMGGLNTLNISDPAHPSPLYQPAEGEPVSGDLFAFAIRETTVYMPVVDGVLVGGIGAIDITNPANPTLTGIVETGDYQTMGMSATEDGLYMLSQGDTGTHLHLYSVQEPLQPVLISTITLPEAAMRLSVVGDMVYAACDGWNCQTLYAIDVTDRHNPVIGQAWILPFGVLSMVHDGQGIIYLTTEGGVWALDVTAPAQPYLAGSTTLPGGYARLKLVDGMLYAAAGEAGLFVFTVER